MSFNSNRTPQDIQNFSTYQWDIDALEKVIIIILCLFIYLVFASTANCALSRHILASKLNKLFF